MKTQSSLTIVVLIAALSVLLFPAAWSTASTPLPLDHRAVSDAASNAPMQFTSQGHILGFRTGEFYVSNATYALRVEFLDANPIAPMSDTPSISDGHALPLSHVTYANLWEGITLAYDAARSGVVRSSYRLEPHADPRAIHLRYYAPITLNPDGTLTIAYATGQMIESAPMAWQEVEGERVPVAVQFVLRNSQPAARNSEVRFVVGEYDETQPLFIDPTLTWNTFLGGSANDAGWGIAVDTSGNVYVAGYSDATWGSPVITYTASADAFVAKLDSSGNLIWNTFLGGSGSDVGFAIAVDGSGNVYVAGHSTSTWGSPVITYTAGIDAFAAKLDSSGNLIWNTFLGGGGTDAGYGIAVDGSGNVYVAGEITATWGSPVITYTAGYDAFAAKLDSNGALTWNTFLGGSGDDPGRAVAVDASGNVYVAGWSGATWGSPVRGFTLGLGPDAFAAKLDASGNLIWNTFLGGSESDAGSGIAVDRGGNVYVAGYSYASWGSPVRAFSGGVDAFVAKLDSSGNLTWNASGNPISGFNPTSGVNPTWNTFLGGSGLDWGNAIAVDESGNVYVAGDSSATWGSPVRAYTSIYDPFAAKLNSSGALTWNTFLGGNGFDYGNAIAVDGIGNVYVAGRSDATWGSPVRAYTAGLDAQVAKIGAVDLYLPLIMK